MNSVVVIFTSVRLHKEQSDDFLLDTVVQVKHLQL